MAVDKFYITKKAAIVWVAVILSIFVIGGFTYFNRHIYSNCRELGHSVLRGNWDYNPALDADHDGIACE